MHPWLAERLAAQIGVDTARGDLAVLRAGDEQRRRESRVAAGEHARDAGLERDRIDLERSCRRDGDAIFRRDEREVRRLPDREDHGVGVNDSFIVLVELRTEAAGVVEYFDAFNQFDSDRVAVADDDALRTPAGHEADALVARDVEFLAALRGFHRGHLVAGFEARDRDFQRAAPCRFARRIERHSHRARHDGCALPRRR